MQSDLNTPSDLESAFWRNFYQLLFTLSLVTRSDLTNYLFTMSYELAYKSTHCINIVRYIVSW